MPTITSADGWVRLWSGDIEFKSFCGRIKTISCTQLSNWLQIRVGVYTTNGFFEANQILNLTSSNIREGRTARWNGNFSSYFLGYGNFSRRMQYVDISVNTTYNAASYIDPTEQITYEASFWTSAVGTPTCEEGLGGCQALIADETA